MSVRSKTTRHRSSIPVTHATVELKPDIKPSDLKRFMAWYYSEMKPDSPLPQPIKKILDKASVVKYMSGNGVLPSIQLRKRAAAKKKKADDAKKKPTKKTVVIMRYL